MKRTILTLFGLTLVGCGANQMEGVALGGAVAKSRSRRSSRSAQVGGTSADRRNMIDRKRPIPKSIKRSRRLTPSNDKGGNNEVHET